MSKKHSHYIQLDLILLLLFFVVVSVLAIYNAQQLGQYPGQNFYVKQIIFYALGVGVAMGLQFIDLDQLYKASKYLYIIGVLSLVVLHFSPDSIAKPINNARSWFTFIPFMSIQPSEFLKIFFIVFIAFIITHHIRKFETVTLLTDFYLIIKVGIYTILPVMFIWQQPDMGTSLVYVFISTVMILLSGVNWKLLATIGLVSIVSIAAVVFLMINLPEVTKAVLPINQYQIDRVMTWFDPTEQDMNDRYHIDLSLQTIGSGQLTGKGMGHAQVSLPEAHTDFIFSIIGESFGFIGAALVIFVFFLLHYKLVIMGMKNYEINAFAALICYGFMALLLIHTFQNIGMTIGLTPITGIPLLFLSYGGSTTISTMLGFGIIYRIAIEYSRHNDFLFK